MAQFISPADVVWLWSETETSPTHVVILQIFRPRPGSAPHFIDEFYASITSSDQIKPGFRRRPYKSRSTAGQLAWASDEHLDMTAHVHRATLPAPGRIRELLEYVGSMHDNRLDRSRPMWEARLVDGLEDGRFALLTKLHHSMFDGVNMGRHMVNGLSTDPEAMDGTPPWIIPAKALKAAERSPKPATAKEEHSGLASMVPGARKVFDTAGDVLGSLKTVAKGAKANLKERELPFVAPDSILNAKTTNHRRFAGDAWPIDRLKQTARRTGTTINDVSLAMCAAALRGYLIEQNALPARSLVAGVPISLSGTSAEAAGRDGNALSAVLCNLGTDIDDPIDRLNQIHNSMQESKALMSGIDTVTATVLGAGVVGGMLLPSLSGLRRLPRPAFNLVISNVPGVRKSLYFNGCELTDFYPSSAVVDGQALNITLLSYVDRIAIGLTACPEAVPHVQRILIHLEEGLAQLEKASA